MNSSKEVTDSVNTLVGILTVDDLIELFSERVGDFAKIITREQIREKAIRI